MTSEPTTPTPASAPAKPAPKHFAIDAELLVSVINYLRKCPYGEVETVVPKLMALPALNINKEPKSE